MNDENTNPAVSVYRSVGRECFRLTDREPREGDRGDCEEGREDCAPACEPHTRLSGCRRTALSQYTLRTSSNWLAISWKAARRPSSFPLLMNT